ncbi:hypothetical protein ECHHL_0982 [Ehrlichia chaffeensis str. Heartland]|uniref:Uncharacterized protein n=1 Tax=Ehrlichia chaffeensis (strain ATCC CRL-10679 / Arkansas) TaxID=205920 RepID=Q2GI24_EHRCR|nr:hypothetical protein [Ehrlichia chaffeensis]ABD45545.1 hypothetical protein ECH_0079 [Ehrlichia chaffeensis str. Arkansas]AHX04108.1 hypothetical protein ECHHL_0982 [Ehrlichia chaffeensis str. Heartland]AHX06044.1 hypothetical protein ECHJAX_1003 [Ehrlichia chaffeensis str. Jax]AHX07034.1 hypothetical protein ECHLIB_1004 [Ehrlichia chaffeensis str. Liberty]AHX07724.1 hypothetical protein ECHOSC_0997 [Ehrlichia chaffeensis str. Osceola]
MTTKNTPKTQKGKNTTTKPKTKKATTTSTSEFGSTNTNDTVQDTSLTAQTHSTNTTTNNSEFWDTNTNNTTQTTSPSTQTSYGTDPTLSDMDLINLKKVESNETEIIYESNTTKQSNFFKDLWYSLKGYFSSAQ